MKASELRIGNWVNVKQYPYENEPYKVTSLHGDNTFTIDFKGEIKGCFRTSIIEPIPLTEEWLLNLGFRHDGYDYWNGPAYFELADCGDGKWINSVNGHEYDHGVKIQYVHQLQNLYFALTDEELQLSE